MMNCENIVVANDGDVTALAGAMSLDSHSVLGISMSTSQATGFVDSKGCFTGWLNELCFAPVNLSPLATMDEWSGDVGCGVHYFSQEAVLRLAEKAGMHFAQDDTPRQKLRSVQIKAEQGNSKACAIFGTIGTFLGHTLAYYHQIYQFQYVLLLGRVMLGAGGDLIFNRAQKVLAEEYPQVASCIALSVPEDGQNQVGQALAAAALPEC